MKYAKHEFTEMHPHNGEEFQTIEVSFLDGTRINFHRKPTEAEIQKAYLRKKAQKRIDDQIYNIKTQLTQEILRHPKNKTFSVTIK